jgi:hypothetical protein
MAQSEKEVKTTETIPSARLNQLVRKWNESAVGAAGNSASSAAWIEIAKHVRDKMVSRDQLRYAFIKIRGMKESSASVEASRMLRFQRSEKASEMLDRAIAGEDGITVRDLRHKNVLRGIKSDMPLKDAVGARLRSAARYAVHRRVMKRTDFVSAAENAYIDAIDARTP